MPMWSSAPLMPRRAGRRQLAVAFTLMAALLAFCPDGKDCRASGPDPDDPAANCVDSCIARYATALGKTVSPERIVEAIDRLGLERNAKYRSLEDCRQLLQELGLPAKAIPFSVSKSTVYPPVCILYLPPEPDTTTPGHVILITSKDGQKLSIFDPAARVEKIEGRADAALFSRETIAIMPEDSYFQRALGDVAGLLCLSLAIGFGVATPIVFLLRRRAPRPAPQAAATAAALIGVAIALTGMTGCSKGPLAKVVAPAETQYDFGVVDGTLETVTHTFRIDNRSEAPVAMTPMASSCSCVIVDNKYQGLTIAPGSSESITVTIRLAQKTGPFQEHVYLRFEPEVAAKPARLELRGFVTRGPVASSTALKFEALDGQKQAEELEIVYARLPGESQAELTGVEVEGPDARAFEVAKPVHSIGTTQASTLADVWHLPITFRSGGDVEEPQASVRITFRKPKAVISVSLAGRKLNPVEPLGPRTLFLPDLKVGEVREQKVYLRFHDKAMAGAIALESDPKKVWGTLDAESRTLRLSVRPDQSGKFSYPLKLMHKGVIVCVMNVTGSAL